MSENIYHSELVIQPKVRSSYTVFHDATRAPPKSPVRYTESSCYSVSQRFFWNNICFWCVQIFTIEEGEEGCLEVIWVSVFENGPSKICGWQPLKNLKWLSFTNFSWSILEFIVSYKNYFSQKIYWGGPQPSKESQYM